jgi:SAM-dependent methyltransferase
MAPILIPKHLARGKASLRVAKVGARWAATFEALGGLVGTSRVLDIGCGPGRMAIGIGERYDWTTPYLGFDIDKKAIDFCRGAIAEPHPGFRFVHMDIRNRHYNWRGAIDPARVRFPAEDAFTDFAFATSVFTHLFAAEMAHYVAEAHRCLAPGGCFLASYFLLDEEAERQIAEGQAKYRFRWRQDAAARSEFWWDRGKAVAYPLSHVLDLYAQVGFADVAFHRGAWSGLDGHHSQDVIVARKA